MTPAELNILINVRAKAARDEVIKLQTAVRQLDIALAAASGSLTRFIGTLSGITTGLKMAEAAMANLARNLSLIGKSGANKTMSTLGANAGLAAAAMMDAAAAAELLNGVLAQTVVVGNSAAAAIKSVAASSAAMNGAAAASNTAANGAKNSAAATNAATTATNNNARATANSGAQLQRFSGNWEQYAGKTRAASKEVDLFRNELGATMRNVTDYSGKVGQTISVTGNAASAGSRWADSIKRQGDELTKLGSRMQWAGRQMSLYFTAPTAIAIGLGTKWILELQKEQTNMKKVYDAGLGDDINNNNSKTAQQFEILTGKLKELSNQTGTSQEEITKMATAWAQAGKSGKALLEYTKLTNQAMIVGDTTAEQAAEGMQAISLQWGLTSKAAADGVSQIQGGLQVMNLASNITQVTMQDLFTGMEKVGSTGKNLGFTFTETTAILTALTRVTGSAATAGNGLKSIYTRLEAPTKGATSLMFQLTNGIIDMNSAAWQAKKPIDRLREIGKATKGIPVDQMAAVNKELFGLFQISRGSQTSSDIVNLGGNINKVLNATKDGVDKNSNSFKQWQQEIKTYMESNPQKFKIAGTMIKNSLMDVVIILLPYILATAKAIAKMAQAFADAGPGVQHLVLGLAIFLALIGPLAAFFGAMQILVGTGAKTLAFFGRNFTAAGRAAKKGGEDIGTAAASTGKASGGIRAAATRIWRDVTTKIGGAFKRTAAQARAGSAETAAAAGAGARETSAAWGAGLAGMVGETGRAYGTMATEANIAYGTMLADQRAFIAKRHAANRAANIVLEGEVIAGGAAGATAARAGGKKAGEEAAEAAKKGAKVKAGRGGILGSLFTAVTFIPPGFFGKIGGLFKSGFSKLGGPLKSIFSRLGINSVKTFGQVLVRGLAGKGGLIGAAIAAVVGLIAYAWDDVKRIAADTFGGDSDIPIFARPFVFAVKVIAVALSKLPQLVVDIFKSVVNIIVTAAKAVYKAFSYINPFAHHSPSLVENVTKGMAVVTGQFSDASKSIQNDTRAAYASISKFGKATAGLSLRAKNIETENTNKDLNKADPSGGAARSYAALSSQVDRLQKRLLSLNSAMIKQQRVVDGLEKQIKEADKAIDAMNDTLEVLQKMADATSDALDKANTQLDYYTNAPLKGMRAMSDAIFANEMAQKKLQLQIAKLDDAGDSVDSLADKYANLQGQIESLTGERSDLQAKGAGSDILSTYDKMIADLKKQQGAAIAEGPSTEVEKLNKQLDELSKKGDILDLENSLQFDPLTRQIEQAANAEKELDFNTAIAGVTAYKAQVEGLTVANNLANSAVEAQQAVVDNATKSRDELQKKLDVEQENLDDLKNTYDITSTAIDDTKSAMDEITTAASTVNQRLDEMAQAQKDAADAAKEHADALKKLKDEAGADDLSGPQLPEGGYEIPEPDTTDLENGLNNLFPNIEKKVKDWFKQLGPKIKGWATTAIKTIGKAIGDFLRDLPKNIAEGGSYIAGWLIGLLVKGIAGSAIAVGKAFGWLLGLPGKIVSWLVNADWSKVWDFIKGVFTDPEKRKEFFDKIGDIGGDIVAGIINGIAKAVAGIFSWIGEHFVKPFVDGFKDAMGIHSPSTVFESFGWDIIAGLLQGLAGKIGDIIGWLIGLPNTVINAVGDAASWLYNKGKDVLGGLIGGFIGKIGDVIRWIAGVPNTVINAIGDAGRWLFNKGKDTLGGLISGFGGKIGDVIGWIAGVPGTVAHSIGDVSKTLWDKGKNIVQGLLDGAGSILPSIGKFFLDKLPGWIKEPFKKALGIHSPSTVFAEYGDNVGQGLVNGISDQMSNVENASNALASAAAPAVTIAAPLTEGSPAAAAAVAAPTVGTADTQAQLAAATASLQKFQVDTATILGAVNANVTASMDAMNASIVASFTAMTANVTVQLTATQNAAITTITATVVGVNAQLTVMIQNVQTFGTTLNSTWSGIWLSLQTTTNDGVTNTLSSWTMLADGLSNTLESKIRPVFDGMASMLTNMEKNFTSTVTNIGTIWDGIKEKVAAPSRFVINDVYNGGVRVAWSKVNKWLGVPELEQFTAGFASGGSLVPISDLSNPNNPRNIKNGGPLRAASGSRDSTLFAGMRGEYVMNKKMVDGAGGIGNLEAWRSAVNRGVSPISTGGTVDFGAVPGFASGGALGMDKRKENQAIPGVIQQVPEVLKPWFGKAYDYGGGGTPGYDCSGWTGAVHKVLFGKSPIGRIWDTEVNYGSFGYKRGKDGYWSMGVHNGGGGQSSHTAGTLAGVNYESGGSHGNSIWGGPAAGTINPQFEHQYYLPSLGGNFVGNPGGGGTSVAMTPMLLEQWDNHMKGVKDKISALKYGGVVGEYPSKGFDQFNRLREVVKKKGEKKDAEAAAAAAAAYGQAGAGSYGGGVERWRSVVQDVLRLTGNPLSWDELTLQQMNTESGGNPQAINLYDSNAQAGHPSKGLMQVIDSTFAGYRDPQFPNDIWDPRANIAAGINWAKTKGGPPAVWGQGHGYDNGGWLNDGAFGFNSSGKPEPILTGSEWNILYTAAKKPAVQAKDIADGYVDAMKEIFGLNTDRGLQDITTEATDLALGGQNAAWNPQIISAAEDTTAAVTTTTDAVKGTTDAVYKTTDTVKSLVTVSSEISDGIATLTQVMAAAASTAGAITMDKDGNLTGVNFSAFAPLITVMGTLIEKLPDADPTYVSWAGTGIEQTNAMKQEKLLNDISNSSKGLYYAFKTIAPPVLKHTAIIGTAIEGLVKQDSEAWTAALAAIASNNPVGYLVAVILVIKEIATILPLILNAIMDIGPAIIESLIAYFTKFEPDAVYSYGSYDAANQAVNDNLDAIKGGATGPNFETVQQGNSNEYTFNFLGDINVAADSQTSADSFIDNLLGLAGV